MNTIEREAVRNWASTRDLPPDIADRLERVAPWIFRECGYAPDLATEVRAEAMSELDLSEDDVRSLGDWLSRFSDDDEPPLIPPQRLYTLDQIRIAIRDLPGAYLKVPSYTRQILSAEVQTRTASAVPANTLAKVQESMLHDPTIVGIVFRAPDGSILASAHKHDA